MRELIKRFCIALFSVGIIGNAWADDITPGLGKDDLKGWAENVFIKSCGSFSIGNDQPCIGNSKGICRKKSIANPEYDDEWGILMMVARDTSDGGAKFCPTFIIARNEKDKQSWTAYYDFWKDSGCVWLCRDGFSGRECRENVTSRTVTDCDTAKLLQSNYDSFQVPDSSSDREWINKIDKRTTIPNWNAKYSGEGDYSYCKDKSKDLNRKEKHDVIFAVSDWLASGRGAWVRPYMVRARQDDLSKDKNGKDDNESWIEVYPAYDGNGGDVDPILACLNGFKPNEDKTDCVAINKDVCGIKNWCSGWDEEDFNSDIHYEETVNGCLQWRCKDQNKHLSDDNVNCIANDTSSPSVGVDPTTGKQKTCDKGFMITKNGDCAPIKELTQNDLIYGISGRTKSESDVADQCWTKTYDDYKECVLGK